MVRHNVDSVFVAASRPRQIRVSPRRDVAGSDWMACVRAELTSVMGKSLGPRTYRVTISGGVIIDRQMTTPTTIAHPKATHLSGYLAAFRMINSRLTIPLKLNGQTNGLFQSFR